MYLTVFGLVSYFYLDLDVWHFIVWKLSVCTEIHNRIYEIELTLKQCFILFIILARLQIKKVNFGIFLTILG